MSILLLILALISVILSWNAVRMKPGRFGPLWFPAMFTGELAPFLALGQTLVTGGFAWAGWAGGWAGITALVLMAVSVVMLAINHGRGFGTRRVVEWAAAEVIGEPIDLSGTPWLRLLRP